MPEEQFQELLESLVQNIIKKQDRHLTKEEIKEIAKEILPDLDRMIAEKVKNHFVALAYAIIKKFGSEEEKMDAKDT